MEQLNGRVAVVTGAASGIGLALAQRFAAEGMRVVMADVEAPALDAASAALASTGADVLAVRTDVSQQSDVEALARAATQRFGAVHVLCNNAGVGGAPSASWDQSLEDWRWVMGVNFWGVVHGLRAFVPMMLKHGEEGHVVNTASVAGLVAGAAGSSYTASKFAVVGLTEVLHHELTAAGGKIGASVLCPALTNTRIIESGRNHPGGPMELPKEGTPEHAMFEMIKGVFAGGMPPSEVAAQVVDAIRNRRFYVLTHPEHNSRYTARTEAMIGGGTPTLFTG